MSRIGRVGIGWCWLGRLREKEHRVGCGMRPSIAEVEWGRALFVLVSASLLA